MASQPSVTTAEQLTKTREVEDKEREAWGQGVKRDVRCHAGNLVPMGESGEKHCDTQRKTERIRTIDNNNTVGRLDSCGNRGETGGRGGLSQLGCYYRRIKAFLSLWQVCQRRGRGEKICNPFCAEEKALVRNTVTCLLRHERTLPT